MQPINLGPAEVGIVGHTLHVIYRHPGLVPLSAEQLPELPSAGEALAKRRVGMVELPSSPRSFSKGDAIRRSAPSSGDRPPGGGWQALPGNARFTWDARTMD